MGRRGRSDSKKKSLVQEVNRLRESGYTVFEATRRAGVSEIAYREYSRDFEIPYPNVRGRQPKGSNNDATSDTEPRVSAEDLERLKADSQALKLLQEEHREALSQIEELTALIGDIATGKFKAEEIDIRKTIASIVIEQWNKSKIM
jgi:hypothetical protein